MTQARRDAEQRPSDRALGGLWRRLDLIGPTGRTFLRRRGLDTRWGGILVHRIDEPDPGMDLHDHPWAFVCPTDLEKARQFWVRITQSFSHAGGDRTGWSVTTNRTHSVPESLHRRIDRFTAVAARLANVTIECCDAAALIDRLATPDTVAYVDPPYLGSTRRSGRSTRASDYRRDMPDEADHRRLAEVLHTTPAAVILSGYRSDLYDDLYNDWERHDVQVATYSSKAAGNSRAPRTESIWTNRTLDGRLQFPEVATA